MPFFLIIVAVRSGRERVSKNIQPFIDEVERVLRFHHRDGWILKYLQAGRQCCSRWDFTGNRAR